MSTGDTEFPDDGRAALNAFLAKWIYADQDTGSGLVNAMRGHDLMATMYGRQIGATIAFNGVGTFDEATTVGVPRRLMMNYRLFPGMAMIHDPEYSNTTGRLPTDPAPSGAYVPKSAPTPTPISTTRSSRSCAPRRAKCSFRRSTARRPSATQANRQPQRAWSRRIRTGPTRRASTSPSSSTGGHGPGIPLRSRQRRRHLHRRRAEPAGRLLAVSEPLPNESEPGRQVGRAQRQHLDRH